MEKKKRKEIGILLFLVLAIVLMTIGFAAYTQTLNITGTVKVKGSPWDVHFIPNDITRTSGSVTPDSTTGESPTVLETVTNTDFTFTVTLQKPGDFYEATITAKNYGTVAAQLKSITMSSLTSDQQKYLSYSITYNNGTTYTATTNNLAIAMAAGAEHPVKVRVQYLQPANASDLPSSDVTVTVTGSLNYESV